MGGPTANPKYREIRWGSRKLCGRPRTPIVVWFEPGSKHDDVIIVILTQPFSDSSSHFSHYPLNYIFSWTLFTSLSVPVCKLQWLANFTYTFADFISLELLECMCSHWLLPEVSPIVTETQSRLKVSSVMKSLASCCMKQSWRSTIKLSEALTTAQRWSPAERWILIPLTIYHALIASIKEWQTVGSVYLKGCNACHTEIRATCKNQSPHQGRRWWQVSA